MTATRPAPPRRAASAGRDQPGERQHHQRPRPDGQARRGRRSSATTPVRNSTELSTNAPKPGVVQDRRGERAAEGAGAQQAQLDHRGVVPARAGHHRRAAGHRRRPAAPRKPADPQPQPGALTSASATRPTAAASSAAPTRSGRPWRAVVLALRHDPDGEQHGGQADRQVDPEHPAPADLDQAAADDRAERGAQRAERGPGADRLRAGPRAGTAASSRDSDAGTISPAPAAWTTRAAISAPTPGRQPAQQRPEAEDGQAGDEQPPPPDPVGPPAGRHQHGGEHDRVGVQHPGQRAEARARVLRPM